MPIHDSSLPYWAQNRTGTRFHSNNERRRDAPRICTQHYNCLFDELVSAYNKKSEKSFRDTRFSIGTQKLIMNKLKKVFNNEKLQTRPMAKALKNLNIADRLPENSSNSFIDLPSQKTIKKTDQKISLFIEGWYVIFWLTICKFLLHLLAAL